MRALLIFVLGWVIVAASAAAQDAADIAGVYATAGTIPGFTGTYTGQTEIIVHPDGTIRVIQRVGSDTLEGSGTLHGRKLDVFYHSHSLRAVYVLQPDGSLLGRWGTDAQGLPATEELTPIR